MEGQYPGQGRLGHPTAVDFQSPAT